jgi:hypothetical protein
VSEREVKTSEKAEEIALIWIDCPKEEKKVPHWRCSGSYTQNYRDVCRHLRKIEINFSEQRARVDCGFKRE